MTDRQGRSLVDPSFMQAEKHAKEERTDDRHQPTHGRFHSAEFVKKLERWERRADIRPYGARRRRTAAVHDRQTRFLNRRQRAAASAKHDRAVNRPTGCGTCLANNHV